MMEKIEMEIECPECSGTGVYMGIGERGGAAVVCTKCNGSGKCLYRYQYKKFTGRKIDEKVKRVYLRGMGYCISTGIVTMKDSGITIDFDKEGVSYQEFLNGTIPKHIKSLGCPMLADQSACHGIDGFTSECNKLNGGYVSLITNCKHKSKMHECWNRFEKSI